MRSFLTVILATCAILSTAQTKIDSLLSVFDALQIDSSTINTLYDINEHYLYATAYDSLITYTTHQIEIGKQLNHTEATAWGYFDRASAHWHTGLYNQGLQDSDSAQAYFYKDHDTTRVFNALYLKGMIEGDKGNHKEAIQSYYKAIEGFKSLGKLMNQGAVLNSVALVHQWMNDYPKAEEEFLRSIEMLEQTANKERLGMSMSNLAVLYANTNRYEKAMATHQAALQLFTEIDSEWGIASMSGNIGDLLNKMGRSSEAVSYLNKNIDYQRKKGDPKELAGTLIMLGDALVAESNYNQAKAAYNEALELVTTSNMLDYQKHAHEALSHLASITGNHQEAYIQLQQANVLRDTIYSREKMKAISELNTQYDTEKRDAQIALLDTENKLKDTVIESESKARYMLIAGLLLLAFIAALLLRNQQVKMKNQRLLSAKNEAIKTAEFNRELGELELKALRAQMNPHFIFNCMNSINRLILEDENDNASRNLTKFSKLIRLILEHSEKKTITLSEELEMLKTYIELEAQRFKGKMSHTVTVDQNIDPTQVELPSMILQPYVENAIWHGIMHKTKADGHIAIHITEQDNHILCSIEDNGVGRSQAMKLKDQSAVSHQSVAMNLTEARLSLLSSSNQKGTVHITDLTSNGHATGTKVDITIPI